MKNVVKLESGKELWLTSRSSREVILRHHSLSSVNEIKNKKGKILKLQIDNYSVEVGTILRIKLFNSDILPFKVNYIEKLGENKYSLLATRLTKATRWIMPMLRVKNETYTSMRYYSHLVNCYVGTESEGYMPYIYLVYRFSGSMEFREFENSLRTHELFDSMVDIDKHHIMYIFEMTEQQKEIFNLFKLGKYSKFPEDYKKRILNFVINPADSPTEADREVTVTYGALYKTGLQRQRIEAQIGTDLPKDAEYFSIPIEKEEVFNGDIEIPSNIEISPEMGIENEER